MDNVLIVISTDKDGDIEIVKAFAPEAVKKADKLFKRLVKKYDQSKTREEIDAIAEDGYWDNLSDKKQVYCSWKDVQR